MLFYLFAILAVMLFGKNDPYHFASLHLAFLSLWRSATGEDWTDLMYIGMYGCAPNETIGVSTGGGFYNDDLFRDLCTSSKELGGIAAIFHITFFILAGLVLLNLMVGVIIGSIFEAKAGMDGDRLEVTVTKAQDLPRADVIGSSDPFCSIDVSKHPRKTTKVVKNCLNPHWNETFEFDINHTGTNEMHHNDRKQQVIKFIVWDWDFIGSNDVLGEFRVNYQNLRWNKPVSFELELDNTPEDQDTGKLFVVLKKVSGPNHLLLEEEKDKWDNLMDKYYVAKELLQECKTTLSNRKGRKQKEQVKKKWKKLKKEGRVARLLKNIKDIAGQKADSGSVSVDKIQNLFGRNSALNFSNRTNKTSHQGMHH